MLNLSNVGDLPYLAI